jgi:ribose 5-phosphate isomerase B
MENEVDVLWLGYNSFVVHKFIMKIGLAADHAGFEQKGKILLQLRAANYNVIDFGALVYDKEDDYPDIVLPLAEAISNKEIDKGIAICGSGVGVSIAANKVPGVRAALVTETYSAHQGVEHDNMNLICIGARVLGDELIRELIATFLNASFQNDERFHRRLNKVNAIEEKYFNRQS